MASEVKTNKISPATGTDVTLGDSSDTFTLPSGSAITVASGGDINVASGGEIDIASGATLDVNGTIDVTGATLTGFPGLFSSYAHIVDSKAEGTNGGTFTLGAWRTRDLNTEVTDPDGIVSISANAFTLAAGSYLIKWICPAYSVGEHKSRLYDVTGTAGIQNGMSAYSPAASSGAARVTPSGSNVYRIEHWCITTLATYGFGVDTGTGTGVEIYAQVEILKES